jgi:hypothetical protein
MKLKLSHSLASPFGGFGLLLLFLYAGLVIKASFLDVGEEAFLCQFSFEVLNGFLDLVVVHNDFHSCLPRHKIKKAPERMPGAFRSL